MNTSEILKSSQNQAVAAWIDYLNQMRLDALITKLASQKVNLEDALRELSKVKSIIAEEIIERNRGGAKGVHGFIAEVAESGIVNARKLVEGAKPCYQWVNDNGPADMIRNGIEIQQKFVRGDGHWGLTHVLAHSKTYPDFLKNGGKYQLPSDFYDRVKILLEMSPEEAKKLVSNGDSELTYSAWKWVRKYFSDNNLSLDDFEPSVLDYSDAQKGAIDKTLAHEEQNIKSMDKDIRDQAYKKSKPNVAEGTQATVVSAVTEGGMRFCLGIAKKRKAGKKLSDFTSEDWREIGIDTAKGTGTGAFRGATVYTMTNFTATPAAVANACVTAAIGVAAQAQKLHEGTVTEDEFIANSEILCLDVSVSAVASILGQVAIPIPVLGSVIGNTVGMFLYGLTKDHLDAEEQTLISGYITGIEKLNQTLDEHYCQFIEILLKEFAKYKSMLEFAFDPQVNVAFDNSIAFADYVGVAPENVLRSKADIDSFFINL